MTTPAYHPYSNKSGRLSPHVRRMLLAIALLLGLTARAQTPFLRNFSAADYGAHNRNFSIVATDDGMVYVANFEGLLYYDKAEWRVIHTPKITRVTALCRDDHGTIWAGGYNYIGYLKADARGLLQLHEASKPGAVQGEVEHIRSDHGQLRLRMSDGKTYALDGSRLTVLPHTDAPPTATGDDGLQMKQQAYIGHGLTALATDNGIVVKDTLGHILHHVTEQNGLCSDNVNSIAYDGHGLLWGATEKGIFAMALPSAYMRYTAAEGLRGEVFALGQMDGTVYAGTINGLYRKQGLTFTPVEAVNHTCWQILTQPDGLLLATSNGVYRMAHDHSVQQLSSGNTLCVLPQPGGFYAGELDGLFYYANGRQPVKVSNVEKVTKIYQDRTGVIWLQTIYGQVWKKPHNNKEVVRVQPDADQTMPATLVKTATEVMTISANAVKPIPYPQFSHTDPQGCTWITNNEGRALSPMTHSLTTISARQLRPLAGYVVQALLHNANQLWIGADYGAVVLRTDMADPALTAKPKMLIRSVSLGADSVLWGGVGTMPAELPTLGSDERHLRFTFATDHAPLVGKTLYRYRLSTGTASGSWTAWSAATQAVFSGLASDDYTFEVQALTAAGDITDAATLAFSIARPFYMRWYMMLLYLVLAALLVAAIMRMRLRRLEREKQQLESIVQERTAEVVRQKNEIEEKSVSLEKALQELGQAQHELIRQEKMATVGKLTQGLIDRILNPLNYINNFAKLSEGLVKDLQQNIDDERDTMDADNYEDTLDVLGMLHTNLDKVCEHGQNTTRTLKAMEEMLKDRSGGIAAMDLAAVLRQDMQMVQQYHAGDISTHHIALTLNCPYDELSMQGNAEQISKAIMSMLANAVYAVVKKAQRTDYKPEIALDVSTDGQNVTVSIDDNGIGIEPTIIDKVFDPFFTTKTTGEASGVGLYLSREVAQNHGGDIHVESVKDEHTRFTITLKTGMQPQ